MHSPHHQSPPPLGDLRYLSYRQAYVGVPESVPLARGHFARVSKNSGLDPAIADMALLVLSEMVTNVVSHLGCRYLVSVSVVGMYQRRVRIEVYDPVSDRIPVMPPKGGIVDGDADGGRGLGIIVMLSAHCGVTPDANGKIVWAELDLTEADVSAAPAPCGGGAPVSR
ncbi:anti-sigma regulatory factor (Ser/Thr protein kinase) [Streptomyces sp. V3I8]|uniref:ATP-binding protein n=1 Tax=Streptomyces sp. V3I8 TaxID=3042279 RepID=UPI00278BA948|nr:ATP-binding protein [Streptomyces sp. V3I8]MDQ1041497.1 anti-sigma regulatory factor (Ser/Thr protein kinase) [Streptomyces sp. V3I8]